MTSIKQNYKWIFAIEFQPYNDPQQNYYDINSLMIGTSSTFNQKPRFVTNNGDKNEGLLVLSMP